MIKNTHPEWAGYQKWLEGKIADAHTSLEDVGLPLDDIRALQGEIRAYRAIIEAAVVSVANDTSTADYND